MFDRYSKFYYNNDIVKLSELSIDYLYDLYSDDMYKFLQKITITDLLRGMYFNEYDFTLGYKFINNDLNKKIDFNTYVNRHDHLLNDIDFIQYFYIQQTINMYIYFSVMDKEEAQFYFNKITKELTIKINFNNKDFLKEIYSNLFREYKTKADIYIKKNMIKHLIPPIQHELLHLYQFLKSKNNFNTKKTYYNRDHEIHSHLLSFLNKEIKKYQNIEYSKKELFNIIYQTIQLQEFYIQTNNQNKKRIIKNVYIYINDTI